MSSLETATAWPPLPYEEWRPTLDTLHMYMQIVGKLRMALSPPEPHFDHAPLYVSARGLTTPALPVGARTIDLELDLLGHEVVVRASDGAIVRHPLGGAVADFYAEFVGILKRVGVEVKIPVKPSEVPDPIPFPEDRVHDTYDEGHVRRFFHVLSMMDVVLKVHRARFRGMTSPVQFFWGSFDLALNRYSGAETIAAGWWPGDQKVPHPAFYAYATPAPQGIERIEVHPASAAWSASAGEFLLAYDSVRAERDPRQAVHDFLSSTYEGAAGLLGWDPDLTAVRS